MPEGFKVVKGVTWYWRYLMGPKNSSEFGGF
jgi:hypothetical protein